MPPIAYASWSMRTLSRVASLALLITSADAAAQSAKELYDQGLSALSAGRYADAVQAFDASYRREKLPSALYQLGLSYQGMGHPDKAYEALQSYVKFADAKRDGKTVEAARAEIGRLKSSYARFALKLTPADATIDIDGARVAPNQNELWVQTGSRKISVKASGFETYSQTLDVTAGRFDLEIQLRQPTLPPEQRAAALVDEGMALQAAGSLQPAVDKYKEAEAIYSTPRALAQMGLAEEPLGDLGAAEEHINAALRSPKDPWIRQSKRSLKAALARLKRQLATLEISGSPEGTEIFVNDRSVGTLPMFMPLRVAGGALTVRGKKVGFSDDEELLTLPPRATRKVVIELSPAPAPLVAAVPVVAPTPEALPPAEAAVPALTVPPEEPPPTASDADAKPTQPAQADIEAQSDPRDDLELGQPDEDRDAATGFEMAANFGYQAFIGGPKTEGISGLLSPQVLLGARVLWPLSFGIQLGGGFASETSKTKFAGALNPGVYVRGHIQRTKKQFAFDAWAGAGLQPIAIQVVPLKPQPVDISTIDVTALDADDIARAMAGVSYVRTVQSLNVPLELGATFYVTPAFGFDLALGLTFWLPQSSCLHDGNDRLCVEDGLETQTSFFVGGGISVLP